ncbi:LacI family DNA-binding transcriptional regulator [Sporolactobacillus terrae]|uniref:LacI family DNA-binding transcriptional regulator n=1 Tax=Sporolactobacillus terrae TaxID=269673 RepID=A0A410DCM2_9BACL|nr:LacI family DNA-binding transcriptional regulator [Sporolactobacillus terrae]QAA23872.1 LacI family DNA-binding transcriptional regulator [Sporolactobacillus terrae]QAA26843.1 LacI family DNA-binding transcriptional regulator [Sporolactobacillus terrae]UAK15903.1 LacI family DNA-binding transcriptional regulator [Sporolactobacillus terrae]BBO00411.1 LacI family transcriptional regulator [Sporolactobacillus terrae]
MVTIRDVAKYAGVSASTASRAIRNSSLISPETRKKVQLVAKKMNYVPNFNAHNLATNANNTVGIVFPVDKDDLYQNPFYTELIEGINQELIPKHFFMTVALGGTVKELKQTIKIMIENSKIEQFILLYSIENDPILKYLQQRKAKYAVIGKPYTNANSIPYVDNDNVNAGLDATEYLINKGHRQLGYAFTSRYQLVQTDRMLGFHEAIRRNDLYGYNLELCSERFGTAIKEYLQRYPDISAILASDDILAFQVQKAVQRIAPERQIELMGFNDSLFAKFAEPKISTVQIYPKRLGKAAAQLIIQQLEQESNEPFEKIIVPYKIIEQN